MFRTLAEATEIPWPYDWVFDWNRGSDTSTFEGVAKPKRRRSTVAKSTTVGLAPMRAKVQKKKKIIFKGRRTSKAASASKPQSHEGKADTAGSGGNVDQAKEPGAGGRGGGESAALVPSRRSKLRAVVGVRRVTALAVDPVGGAAVAGTDIDQPVGPYPGAAVEVLSARCWRNKHPAENPHSSMMLREQAPQMALPENTKDAQSIQPREQERAK